MANLILYKKGTDTIYYFLKDCKQKNNIFKGLDKKVTVNLDKFNLKWTTETIDPSKSSLGAKDKYDKLVSQVASLVTFEGEVVDTIEEVEDFALKKIRSRYSEVEEFKILRGKINSTVSATIWDTYNTFTNNILTKAKNYIQEHNLS